MYEDKLANCEGNAQTDKKSIQGSIMLMTVKAIDSESLLLFNLFPKGHCVHFKWTQGLWNILQSLDFCSEFLLYVLHFAFNSRHSYFVQIFVKLQR